MRYEQTERVLHSAKPFLFWRKVRDSGSESLAVDAANVISTIPHLQRQAKGAAISRA